MENIKGHEGDLASLNLQNGNKIKNEEVLYYMLFFISNGYTYRIVQNVQERESRNVMSCHKKVIVVKTIIIAQIELIICLQAFEARYY